MKLKGNKFFLKELFINSGRFKVESERVSPSSEIRPLKWRRLLCLTVCNLSCCFKSLEVFSCLKKHQSEDFVQTFERSFSTKIEKTLSSHIIHSLGGEYLTIIPRSLRGHEGEWNNCYRKIQLVAQKYRDKTTLTRKTQFSSHCFGFQSRRFSLPAGYNI